MQMSELARKLHFGDSVIPARPFLYDSIISVRNDLNRRIREMHARSIKENREPRGEYSLEGIGAFLVGAIQKFVRGNYYKNTVPNAPMTIRIKGSDTPLIDTGQMINSTTYITRKKGPKLPKRKIEISGESR